MSETGTTSAQQMFACKGPVWLIGSEADSASPARSYETWYSTLAVHPSGRFHSHVVPECERCSHSDLGFLPNRVPPDSILNVYQAFHAMFAQ